MHSKERPKQLGSVLEGIDLSQSASVSWWADVDVPTRGFKWGGSSRQFGTLRAALDFVLNRLSKTELGTALIEFASPSSPFDFNDPKVREKFEALRDLLGQFDCCRMKPEFVPPDLETRFAYARRGELPNPDQWDPIGPAFHLNKTQAAAIARDGYCLRGVRRRRAKQQQP